MLEALGVRTLGEFAALPAPSVHRPLEADYQALARGESGQKLRPYVPEAPIREELVVSTAQSGAAAVAVLGERIAMRLAGRGRGAARLEITVVGEAGEKSVPITPLMASMSALSSLASSPGSASRGRVLESSEELAEAIGRALGDDLSTAWRLRVAVTGEAVAGDTAELTQAVARATQAETIDALSVVLSSTGSGSWRLTSPTSAASSSPSTLRDERRDAHRRTRRGKVDRKLGRRMRAAELPVQPSLFAERK